VQTEAGLLRLLQLCSPNLPVGAYAFSQGLEPAVEAGWVSDADSLAAWLRAQLRFSLARVDLPLLLRLRAALEAGDGEALAYWNALSLACRESAELRLADVAPAQALARLLRQFDLPPLPFPLRAEPGFLLLWSRAAWHWGVATRAAALGYGWTWLENQVIAATRLLPLGQSTTQRLAAELQPDLQAALATAADLADADIGASLPALAIASMMHESQYTRLFRS